MKAMRILDGVSQPLWPDLAAWAGETAAKVQGLQSSLLPRGGTVSQLPAPVRHRLQNYNSHKRAHRPVSSPLSFLTNHTSRISGKRFQFPKSFLDADASANKFLFTDGHTSRLSASLKLQYPEVAGPRQAYKMGCLGNRNARSGAGN